jgi:hypothetical protein
MPKSTSKAKEKAAARQPKPAAKESTARESSARSTAAVKQIEMAEMTVSETLATALETIEAAPPETMTLSGGEEITASVDEATVETAPETVAEATVRTAEAQKPTAKPYVLSMPERSHNGKNYLDVIEQLCRVLKPERYFEIGTHKGESLKRVDCRSVAVDPEFKIEGDVVGKKPACFLYQMTSDRFFESQDPKVMLGGPVQLAFLDGMHRFEFLLRDFMHTEKHSTPNSVLLLHDCFPLSFQMAERKYNSRARTGNDRPPRRADWNHPAFWWTGDVWKVLWILSQYRPELTIICMDAAPTGLVAVTGLNPSSTILSDRYFEIVHSYGNMETTPEVLEEHYRRYPLIDATEISKEEHLTRCFWF